MRLLLGQKVGELEELNLDLERRVDERTRLLRDANERLALVHEVTNAAHSSLDFQPIFEAVIAGTRRLVGFDQASIARLVDAHAARVFAIAGDLPELMRTTARPPAST